jgi:hypothetical protein
VRNKKTEDNSSNVFLLLHINRVSINASKYNIHIHNKWDDRLWNINNNGTRGRSRKDTISRVYGEFNGEGTNVSIPHLITVSACRSTNSRISITSRSINKTGKLWNVKICEGVNANSIRVL